MKALLLIPFLFICSMVIGQSDKIIGEPIKIKNLEVAQFDFPNKMNWYDAKQACADLGRGWRLPTKVELHLMYKNKDKIDCFDSNYYWSSTEKANYRAWGQYFGTGLKINYDKNYNYDYCVRAVRSL